jgi:cytochrome c
MTIHQTLVMALAIIVLADSPGLGAQVRRSNGVERGRAFVESHCATCHAVGRAGDSPYAPAPPFRTLHERFDVAGLAEALVEGIVVGHKGPRPMPRFEMSPSEADDIISYLKSLESPAAVPR